MLVALAALAVLVGSRWPASPTDPAFLPASVPGSDAGSSRPSPPHEAGGDSGTGRLGLGEADGAIPDNTTVFSNVVPGVVRLDADLLGAFRRAASDAASDGVEFHVDSGWRSAEYQARLLDEAVAKYGSMEEATRWVATPETSAHVKGDAVDIGPSGAAAWLTEHGAAYGLCEIYANEPWHFELRPEAPNDGCPALYADSTQDPRMRP